MSLGTNITKYREMANIKKIDLAKIVGVNRAYITQIENDEKKPSTEVLQKIAKAINTTTSVLLEETKEPADSNRDSIMNKVNELAKTDPDLLVEMCRAKDLPPEARKRLREIASYEIDRFLWEQQHKKKNNNK